MAIIDLSNYTTTLKQSSEGRTGTPDGNIYFDIANGTIEFLPYEEVEQIDFGNGLVDNPLTRQDGIKFEAIYAFENQERNTDEELRKHDRWTLGSFKASGAYRFVNGRTPATETDRKIIRNSGWIEYALDKTINKIYFGNKGLSNIYPESLPYYHFSTTTNAIDFSKPGQINEAILVYDKDTVDNRFNSEIISIRTYGMIHDRKYTDIDLGIDELGGYSVGIALNEYPHPTTNPETMPYSDVWESPTGVWETMRLEKLSDPLIVNEFAEDEGTFSWILYNDNNATLDECIAWLDAASMSATDIDSGDETNTIGRIADTWYYYGDDGNIITRSGTDNLGVYITNIPLEDRGRIKFTSDDKSIKSYEFLVNIIINIGEDAKNDTNAWYQLFSAVNFNTNNPITVKDNLGNDVKGLASSVNENNQVVFFFPYDTDTILGEPGTDKDCVFLCEGDGGVTQAKLTLTITRTKTLIFNCIPAIENNE